jgi:hypothetical protein
MIPCDSSGQPVNLSLPDELSDLEGLIRADLDAIARMITARAHERLFLPRSSFRNLYWNLWNRLAGEINSAVAPLTAETR